jgi:hypothetical protein
LNHRTGNKIQKKQKIKGSAGAAITHVLYRKHPPRRPVLIGQGKLNPPRETGKRFFETFLRRKRLAAW